MLPVLRCVVSSLCLCDLPCVAVCCGVCAVCFVALQCIVKDVVTVQGGEDAQMLYLAGLFPQKSQ